MVNRNYPREQNICGCRNIDKPFEFVCFHLSEINSGQVVILERKIGPGTADFFSFSGDASLGESLT